MYNRSIRRIFIMAEIKPEKTPLARLVLFMICLAALGSIVAGAHYYTIDLPQQAAVVAPANSPSDNCQDCYDRCARDYPNSGGCKYNCLIYVCGKT
jgi:hypothetical protein